MTTITVAGRAQQDDVLSDFEHHLPQRLLLANYFVSIKADRDKAEELDSENYVDYLKSVLSLRSNNGNTSGFCVIHRLSALPPGTPYRDIGTWVSVMEGLTHEN